MVADTFKLSPSGSVTIAVSVARGPNGCVALTDTIVAARLLVACVSR